MVGGPVRPFFSRISVRERVPPLRLVFRGVDDKRVKVTTSLVRDGSVGMTCRDRYSCPRDVRETPVHLCTGLVHRGLVEIGEDVGTTRNVFPGQPDDPVILV